MAGWHKCFVMTPMGHATRFFTGPYEDTWIPHLLLLVTGVTIPVVELLAGGLLLVGFRVREALVALGLILVVVTYGHLLKEPFFSTTDHIFPRFVLLAGVFLLPAAEDRLSIDAWLARGSTVDGREKE